MGAKVSLVINAVYQHSFQISLNAWLWSAVFHTRDLSWTEVFSHFSEISPYFKPHFANWNIILELQLFSHYLERLHHFRNEPFFFSILLHHNSKLCIVVNERFLDPKSSWSNYNVLYLQKMDYFCATSLVMFSLFGCLMRFVCL